MNLQRRSASSIRWFRLIIALVFISEAGADGESDEGGQAFANESPPLVSSQAEPLLPPLETFAQRRAWVIESVAAEPKAFCAADNPFFVAEACFLAGKIEEGRAMATAGYAFWTKKDPKKVRATDFFRLWPAMDCYVRWKQDLDQPTRDQFRQFMTQINCYSYSYTPNLSLIMWTARYLGAQEWGDDAFVPAVRDTTSHYKSDPSIPMRRRLQQVMESAARDGGEEYASRPYGAADIEPFMNLGELARDPELKRLAQFTSETILVRYAPVWLRGALILTSRRSYPDIFNDPMGVATAFWVFFGGDLRPAGQSHMVDAAVLGTPPNSLIENAAHDRTKPYAVENRFQPSSHGLQQSWVTSSYGVFSELYSSNPGAFGQTYPFGVRWVQPNAPDYTFFWFTVPVLDKLEIPGKIRGSHPHGFDARAQSTVQYQGTILYVVNTQANRARYPYGLSFVPGGYQALIDESAVSGRIFLAYPGVLIAFSANHTFTWNRQAPIQMPNAPVTSADSEFRIPGPTFCAAIETAAPAEFPGATVSEHLRNFSEAIDRQTRLELFTQGSLRATYRDRHGNVLKRQFAGSAQINGVPLDFAHWPQAESPWVHQATPNSLLVLTDGRNTRTYNLMNFSIEENTAR